MLQFQTGYYRTNEITSIDEVYQYFPDEGVDFTLNWLFIGTSGVHGSYLTLDDADDHFNSPEDARDPFWLTVLVVAPRMVRVFYGNVLIQAEDVPKLRYLVTRTIEGIQKSQAGSVMK